MHGTTRVRVRRESPRAMVGSEAVADEGTAATRTHDTNSRRRIPSQIEAKGTTSEAGRQGSAQQGQLTPPAAAP
ncbi:hypothetical protein Aduo_018328 [Ancylostoma duodenale]